MFDPTGEWDIESFNTYLEELNQLAIELHEKLKDVDREAIRQAVLKVIEEWDIEV